jgi:penicillin-binding protein 2
VAGKTGTAEFCEYLPEKKDCRRDVKDNLPTHAWYVGYAPYEAPEIAVVAFVYDGGEGSATAIPVVQKVMQRYFTEIAPRPALPPEETEQQVATGSP